jgi:hypothetical protein
MAKTAKTRSGGFIACHESDRTNALSTAKGQRPVLLVVCLGLIGSDQREIFKNARVVVVIRTLVGLIVSEVLAVVLYAQRSRPMDFIELSATKRPYRRPGTRPPPKRVPGLG